MASAVTLQSRQREAVYLTLACLPIVALAVAIGIGNARQWVAMFENRQTIQELAAAGQPVSAIDVAKVYRLGQAPDELAEWGELSRAADHLENRFNDVFAKFPSANELVPSNHPLDGEQVLQQHSELAKPLIAKLEEVSDRFGPTEMYANRVYSFGGLLAREFAYQYHLGNSGRALQLLKLEQADIKPTILKSLEHDFWTLEDLAELRSMVAVNSDLDAAWTSSIASARVQFLDSLEHTEDLHDRRDPISGLFGETPTHVRSALSLYERAETLRGLGTRRAYQAAAEIEKSAESFSIVAVPFAVNDSLPHYYPHQMVRNANQYAINLISTRRVITAIAIKQFQLQEGRWPESLDELTKIGLTSSDWKIVGSQDFGYRVIEDGSAALLWTGGTERYDEKTMWYDKDFQTPPEPPSTHSLNTSYIERMESRIR